MHLLDIHLGYVTLRLTSAQVHELLTCVRYASSERDLATLTLALESLYVLTQASDCTRTEHAFTQAMERARE